MLTKKTIDKLQALIKAQEELDSIIRQETDDKAGLCGSGNPQIWVSNDLKLGREAVEDLLGVSLTKRAESIENNHYEFKLGGERCVILIDKSYDQEAEADDTEPNQEA